MAGSQVSPRRAAAPPPQGVSTVIETYPNGDRYEGNIGADGTKCGWGKYTFANGSVYEGYWRAGKMDGWGEFIEAETQDRFVGEWEQANRRFGIYYYANGDLYQGGFDRSMKHGRGVIWENHEMYEAMYSRDRLLSKTPWRTTRDPDSGRSPPRSSGGGAEVAELQGQLEAARRRCSDLEDTVAQQQTQLSVLTKELQAMQREVQHAGSPPAPRRASSGTRGRPAERQSAGGWGGPRGRSAGAAGSAAAAERGALLRGEAHERRVGHSPPAAPRQGSKVVYRTKRNPTWNTMNENVLREQFRFYY
eukprot:TRINITY_DN1209_c0_g2_i1.p1 TRINITY_DN1209_c0_g2~~TRINITY_DN1209_c0_g2_i1.p1  ORF type:complete len:341 (+),score=107.66 TRINITY_DN1209_c0_g2_i1:110-1024(+)